MAAAKVKRTSWDTISSKIEDLENLSEDMCGLLMHKESSDVTILVKNKTFFCHRAVLAARNEYFRALLYGNLMESGQSKIELKDISPAAFENVLKFTYTGTMDLIDLRIDRVLNILQIAHQYRFEVLEVSVSIYLKDIVDVDNVFAIFEKSILLGRKALENVCGEFIDGHANEVLFHESFFKISTFVLEMILSRNSFFVEEMDLFRAVHIWILHNRKKLDDKRVMLKLDDKRDMLKLVRLPLISCQHLVNEVWPSKLFPDAEILGAIKIGLNDDYKILNHRGCPIVGENVATEKYGSTAIFENIRKSRASIRVTITLGKAFVINCIKILQSDVSLDSRSGNSIPFYGLEKSNDGKKWVPINNYERQVDAVHFKIYFPATMARQFCFCFDDLPSISDIKHIQCMYSHAV